MRGCFWRIVVVLFALRPPVPASGYLTPDNVQAVLQCFYDDFTSQFLQRFFRDVGNQVRSATHRAADVLSMFEDVVVHEMRWTRVLQLFLRDRDMLLDQEIQRMEAHLLREDSTSTEVGEDVHLEAYPWPSFLHSVNEVAGAHHLTAAAFCRALDICASPDAVQRLAGGSTENKGSFLHVLSAREQDDPHWLRHRRTRKQGASTVLPTEDIAAPASTQASVLLWLHARGLGPKHHIWVQLRELLLLGRFLDGMGPEVRDRFRG
ncbi:unnamed protein product, partial [Amoebophrya sp. A120]|eukprot:GSA120T00022185001.1